MEANNEFAGILEKRLKDVPRSYELNEIKKVVRELKLNLKMARDRECANAAQLTAAEKLGNQGASLKARLRLIRNERKSALEQVSFIEAKIDSSVAEQPRRRRSWRTVTWMFWCPSKTGGRGRRSPWIARLIYEK